MCGFGNISARLVWVGPSGIYHQVCYRGVGFGIYINIGGGQKEVIPLHTVKWHAVQFYSDMAPVNQGVGFCRIRGQTREGVGAVNPPGSDPLIIHLGGTSLLDPCEKDTVDAARNLTSQERVNLTLSAQVWNMRVLTGFDYVFFSFAACSSVDSLRKASPSAWGRSTARVVHPGSEAGVFRRRCF